MKKLPKIYKNEINKIINNNKEYCYLKNESNSDNTISIEEKLDMIFHGMGYPYNKKVEIITKDRNYQTSLITRTRNNIITLDNKTIPIKDIISLDIKK